MFATEAIAQRGVGGYQVENSVVLNNASSQYLSRTPLVSGNSGKLTISLWHKRGRLTDDGAYLIGAANDSQNYTHLGFERFGTRDRLRLYGKESNNDRYGCSADGVNRDPADWEHVVVAFDKDQAANEDRSALFINGVQQLVNPATNSTTSNSFFNRAGVPCRIGDSPAGGLLYYDGYISEVVVVDGFYLPPTAFGEWNENAPDVWQPLDLTDGHIDYSGANSFHLDFADPDDLGKDVSGQGNSFARTNISSVDHSTDTPTSNVAVLNPLSGDASISNGNRTFQRTDSNKIKATMAVTSGKWYWEVLSEYTHDNTRVGVSTSESDTASLGDDIASWAWRSNGDYRHNDAIVSSGNGVFSGQVVGLALDVDAGTLDFYLNGVKNTQSFTGITGDLVPAISALNSLDEMTMRFNEDEFTYTPPVGFNALTAKNLPAPAIRNSKKYFDPQIYTGNEVSGRVIPTQNKVDHIITKHRTNAGWGWYINDVLRGAGNNIQWDSDTVEFFNAEDVQAFGAESGYTVGNRGSVNNDGDSYVAYPFTKDQAAGMDIQLYTGDGVSGKTVPHDLGVKPELMIIKRLSNSGASWQVYFAPLGATQYLMVDVNDAAATSARRWNNTEPDASVFTLGDIGAVNSINNTYINYLFASIAGFSKVFSYLGNGSTDGPFVYCGFKPAFILVKRSNTTGSWFIFDVERDTYNPLGPSRLAADLPNAEVVDADVVDFISNGFKVRESAAVMNGSGSTYVGIVFAENPFGMKGR